MMYNNKLAIAIKVDGKILREFKDVVYIPFGTEYSILIKNLDLTRALASISVDGKDIGDGTKFVVPASGEIEVERFIRNGNLQEGNKLKFIERTDAVEKHRGIKIDDGLVKVEWQKEKITITEDVIVTRRTIYNDWPYYYPPNSRPYWHRFNSINPTYDSYVDTGYSSTANMAGRGGTSTSLGTPSVTIAQLQAASSICNAFPLNNAIGTESITNWAESDVGITTVGGLSEQLFVDASRFPVHEQKYSIILMLLGKKEETKIIKPVTVKTMARCMCCDKQNKATANFCSDCGTNLRIV